MFESYIEKIEQAVFAGLPVTDGALRNLPPMLRYSLEGGGKRVRPLLCLLFCEACGSAAEKALPFAVAVEYVHTYSLIHDDLPCMDNDMIRRGKPSAHARFGEANALLAGDALLTHAFFMIAEAAETGKVLPVGCVRAARELALLAGAPGMVGGQYIDLASEGKSLSADALFTMDLLKTGALIEAACVLGCIAAGADETQIDAARAFARNLGVAFQITDDVLEFENETENSDLRNEKATYVSVLGVAEAKRRAAAHTAQSVAALDAFGDRAEPIRLLANALLNRQK